MVVLKAPFWERERERERGGEEREVGWLVGCDCDDEKRELRCF